MISHSKTFLSEKNKLAILKVFNSGKLTSGECNSAFGKKLEETLEWEHVLLCSSGTSAFYKILLALGLRSGDEVLLPNYICNTLISPILLLGAKPIMYDNNENHWLSSKKDILKKTSPKTKVVLVNHTFGFQFEELGQLKKALPADVVIVEDCCHRIVRKSSTIEVNQENNSICSFYSFNATKYLATGEGGAIATNDTVFYNELEKFSIGDNLSDLNCALGLSQLEELDFFVERRREIGMEYYSNFSEFIPAHVNIENSAFFRFPILIEKNDAFWNDTQVAFRKGVESLLTNKIEELDLVNSKKIFDQTVSLPLYPSLTKSEVKLIVDVTDQLISECT